MENFNSFFCIYRDSVRYKRGKLIAFSILTVPRWCKPNSLILPHVNERKWPVQQWYTGISFALKNTILLFYEKLMWMGPSKDSGRVARTSPIGFSQIILSPLENVHWTLANSAPGHSPIGESLIGEEREPPLDSTYCFIAVCHAIAIIIFAQISTGIISAVAVLLPNIVRSIPLPA